MEKIEALKPVSNSTAVASFWTKAVQTCAAYTLAHSGKLAEDLFELELETLAADLVADIPCSGGEFCSFLYVGWHPFCMFVDAQFRVTEKVSAV